VCCTGKTRISPTSASASSCGPPCSRRLRLPRGRGRQRGFDLQAEAIELHDTDSRRALADAQELYASAEARATAVIKQEEDLAVRMRQVNQRARGVEELERRLLEREELDEITLRRELEALGTRESGLDRRKAELDREREGLKDARVQILARELDADAREAGLRDQEARLVGRGWRISRRLVLVMHSMSGASWARRMSSWPLSASAPSGPTARPQKVAPRSPSLTLSWQRYPSWRMLSAATSRRKVVL
jgi:hypothetical protein